MANLTLSVDDDVLEEARKTAARSGTTVNAIVRDQLANLASRDARIERGGVSGRGVTGWRSVGSLDATARG